jgi:hypothetical protein
MESFSPFIILPVVLGAVRRGEECSIILRADNGGPCDLKDRECEDDDAPHCADTTKNCGGGHYYFSRWSKEATNSGRDNEASAIAPVVAYAVAGPGRNSDDNTGASKIPADILGIFTRIGTERAVGFWQPTTSKAYHAPPELRSHAYNQNRTRRRMSSARDTHPRA